MLGQGITPQGYHNIADALSLQQLKELMDNAKTHSERIVSALPPHGEFVRRYSAL